MPIKQKYGYVKIGAAILAEVINVKATSSPTETDSSIIGRSDANHTARVEVEYGPKEIVIMVYVDLTDPAQLLLTEGAAGVEVTHYPGGDAVGMLERIYSDCLVITRDDGSESSFNDLWKYEIKMKNNGGMAESVIT